MEAIRISILAYDECLASELFAFRDVVAFADRFSASCGAPRLRPTIVTVGGKSIVTSGGERLKGAVAKFRAKQLVVVPGFMFPRRRQIARMIAGLEEEIAALREANHRGCTIASICVGTFILGGAGLLEGRRVTTAWAFAKDLAMLHPNADVVHDHLIVEDGPILSAGAFSAAHDLALHLILRYAGSEVARRTRSMTLIEGVRSTQKPFIDHDLLRSRSSPFSDRVAAWLLERLQEPFSLSATARAVAVSPRTLLRRFKAERGQSPLTFLQRIRIDRAKALLEQTDYSIAEVADLVGYGDVSAFRTLFQRLTGMPPGMFRRRFSASARGTQTTVRP